MFCMFSILSNDLKIIRVHSQILLMSAIKLQRHIRSKLQHHEAGDRKSS